MSSLARILTDRYLPAVVFPAVSAVAAYVIYGHVIHSGLSEQTSLQCTPLSGMYGLPYTGIGIVDRALCGPVVCFHALMDPPSNLPFNVDLLTGFGTIVLGLAVEAARTKRHALLGLHIIIVMMAQFATAAVMLPFYWLIFVVTGTARRPRDEGAGVDQPYAEAVLFSFIAGYVVPSLGMLTLDNAYATAIWQPFPLWMFIAQHAYLTIRPRRPRGLTSGYQMIQATYVGVFIFSGVAHLYFAGPIFAAGDFAAYFATLTSELTINTSSTVQAAALGLIQWDIILVQLSTLCACLWTAHSSLQFIGIIAWLAVGGIVVGPAAALVVIFAVRERRLNAKAGSRQGKKD